jgi:hypothetical protein
MTQTKIRRRKILDQTRQHPPTAGLIYTECDF